MLETFLCYQMLAVKSLKDDNELGTLNFREMVELAPAHFADGNNMLMWATLMLLGGAVGKSAQLPLQTWLADAMASI